jgi:hypothetical protein
MPRPKPRSALKVWRTARLRPLARCATERLRWPPIRKDTPQPRLTRQDPSLHPSLVSSPCKPRLSLRSGYLCWCPPAHSSAALAWLPGQQCANTRFAMSKQQGVRKLFHRSFRHDGSHRYGLGECHPLPFRSLSGQRDGFRLRLRSCALSCLNSRGMVMAPHNRLDAPDVHARQAHHRASGGSAPLLRSSSVDGGQGASVQNVL